MDGRKREWIRIVKGGCSQNGQMVLNRLGFSVCEGEVLGVIGLNSRELDAFCGVLTGRKRLNGGVFFFQDRKVVLQDYREAMALGIYEIQRQPAVIKGEDVAANVYMLPSGPCAGLFFRRKYRRLLTEPRIPYPKGMVSRQRNQAVVREFFEQWGLPLDVKAPVETLTHTQLLCVELARAVLGGARVILLNRIGNYCQMEGGFLEAVLRWLKELPVAVVFVDNQLEPLLDISDRVMVLKKGRVEDIFFPEELTGKSLTFLLADRSLRDIYVRRQHVPGERVLTWKLPAYEGGEVCLHEGEILGLADVSGLLPSRLLRLLSGRGRAEDGTVRIGKKQLAPRSVRDGMEKGLCLVDGWKPLFGLIPNESLAVNLHYPRLNRFYPSVRASALLRVAFEEQAEAIGCGKADYGKRPDQVPAIQQLRLCLVRAKQQHAQALVLLAPSMHLDFVSRLQLCGLLDEYASAGMGILLVSLNATLLSDLCDRVWFLHDGSWVSGEPLKPETILEHMREGVVWASLDASK